MPGPAESCQPLKSLDFVVLAVLTDGQRHGYALAQAVAERRRHPVRPGDLYRVLYRMAQAGLIEEAPRKGPHKPAERRVEYRITPAGRRRALEEARLLRSVCDSLLEGRAARGVGGS
jgi:PadR family transcriptional regulator PadR